jgi:hypothetical protein
MADSLTLPERFALLGLLTQVGEASDAVLDVELGITIEDEEREHLVDLGYLTARQAGAVWTYELTDRGWRRCEDEMAGPTPPGADAATRLLYAIIRHFSVYMRRSGLRVADLFTDDELPGSALPVAADVPGRVDSNT